VAHLNSFINRFRAQATKARQAQSRIKMLERMETVAAAHVDSPFHFAFGKPSALPDPLLSIEKASAGYVDRSILDNITMTLRPGCRIGLLGRNGAGKSTLIKLLAGAIEQQGGQRKEAKALNIGYFAQHQLEQLRPDESPLQHLARLEPPRRNRNCATTSAASISAATWPAAPSNPSPAAKNRAWRWPC
jgi:ATP-binding cassette subfamily F protein 3